MRWQAVVMAFILGLASTSPLLPPPTIDMPGHALLGSADACVPCHAANATSHWESNRARPCTLFCLTCHKKEEMAKHHPIDNPVTKPPRLDLRLTRDRKSACFTCHDLGVQRHDTVRWKADSLFARLFRKEQQHKTYFLAIRNDRGQLCLACH
jgi:hypothetical protein